MPERMRAVGRVNPQDNADVRAGVARILSPLLSEAKEHTALHEKINQALDCLPNGASVREQDRVVVEAIVTWMKTIRGV